MSTPIGQRVRTLRLKRKLSLGTLAELAGLSKSYIWEVENKNREITLRRISALADALGVTTEQILYGDSIRDIDPAEIALFRRYRQLEPEKKALIRLLIISLSSTDLNPAADDVQEE
ncbi:helix-turn-helix domain-containing protein [Alsobacter sp. R-9]